jgi:ribonuclease Z
MVIAYVTDAVFTRDNARRIEVLAEGADLLFIEATFLEEEREKAFVKRHLTACQAGWLAKRAGAKRIYLFHFSPKYRGMEGEILAEAEAAFRGEITPAPPVNGAPGMPES